MEWETGAATHPGRVRDLNEDALLVHPSLLLVADGMGGHAAGSRASALAVEGFRRLAESDDVSVGSVRRTVDEVNGALLAEGAREPTYRGMGTTVTGVAPVSIGAAAHWLVFNVGDSRVYRLGPDGLSQLTTDHSEVAELVAAGAITVEQARTYPLRQVITRCLGSDPGPAPDIWVVPAGPGETLMLCSDGLCEEIDDARIEQLLASAATCEEAADVLIRAAVEAGGRDNVTVIVGAAPTDVDAEHEIPTAPRSALSWDVP
jgi:serine/threonine protein phosphatase PrpC